MSGEPVTKGNASSTESIGMELIINAFKLIASSKNVQTRHPYLSGLYGAGIWLLYANSIQSLAEMDGSKAIYVPITSISMFFNDSTILLEKINTSKEMIVAVVCLYPKEGVTRHFWTKVTIPANTAKPSVKQDVQSIPNKSLSPPVKTSLPVPGKSTILPKTAHNPSVTNGGNYPRNPPVKRNKVP